TAPTCSTTATLALGDALALTVARRRNFTDHDFAKRHPGGSLGGLLRPIVEALRFTAGKHLPLIPETATVSEALRTSTTAPPRAPPRGPPPSRAPPRRAPPRPPLRHLHRRRRPPPRAPRRLPARPPHRRRDDPLAAHAPQHRPHPRRRAHGPRVPPGRDPRD